MARILGLSLLLALAAGCQQSPPVVQVPESEPRPSLTPSLAERKYVRDATEALTELSPEQIGMVDTGMRNLLERRSTLQTELAEARAAGLMDGNPKVMRLQSALDRINERIPQYTAEWRDMQVKTLSDRRSDDLIRLQGAFSRPCDLYLDPSELQARKPAITGAKFVDVMDVSGRRMLKFTTGTGDTWLIDPDRIVAARSAK
jgi:hypothetical protein